MRSKPLCSMVHVEFDEPKTGNSLKDRKLHVELKESVPITARTKRFPKGKSTVIAERKQLPVILHDAVTVRKSQGSTPDYIQGDLKN